MVLYLSANGNAFSAVLGHSSAAKIIPNFCWHKLAKDGIRNRSAIIDSWDISSTDFGSSLL